MVPNTRGTPKKKTDGGSRQYIHWDNDQKTWLAEWMNDNREMYCDPKTSRPKKVRLAFEDQVVNQQTLFPRYAEMEKIRKPPKNLPLLKGQRRTQPTSRRR